MPAGGVRGAGRQREGAPLDAPSQGAADQPDGGRGPLRCAEGRGRQHEPT